MGGKGLLIKFEYKNVEGYSTGHLALFAVSSFLHGYVERDQVTQFGDNFNFIPFIFLILISSYMFTNIFNVILILKSYKLFSKHTI